MSAIKRYLSAIGRRGGLKSRRALDSATARAMVTVREARRAFRRFHALCFSSYRADLMITQADVPWVAEQLVRHGNHDARRVGVSLTTLSSSTRPHRTAEQRDSDRSRMTARVVSLRSAEAEDARMGGSAEERVAAVSELTAEAWRLSGRPFPTYSRATMPIVVSTLRGHAQ
jgi:hypothetical protein